MIKTNPLSVKDISLIASNTRKKYNIKPDDAFPILEYIDYLFGEGLLSIQLIDDNDLSTDLLSIGMQLKVPKNNYIEYVY